MEKIRKRRQSFSLAVISGSRSSSGKLVMEYYDALVGIWGGSASTEALKFGCESSVSMNNSNVEEEEWTTTTSLSDDDDNNYSNNFSTLSSSLNQRKRKNAVIDTPCVLYQD